MNVSLLKKKKTLQQAKSYWKNTKYKRQKKALDTSGWNKISKQQMLKTSSVDEVLRNVENS